MTPKKIEELNLKTFQKLVDQVNKIAEENVELKKKVEIEVKNVNEKLEYRAKKNEDEITRETIEIKQMIHTTQDRIEDMIKKFNEEFYNHKSNVLGEIEAIKNKQDILKISYTVNEAKLLETIKLVINKEISNKIKGKESEALMTIWIEEFKEIIKKFEKIKDLQPLDFNARLDELSNIVNSFKQKIQL